MKKQLNSKEKNLLGDSLLFIHFKDIYIGGVRLLYLNIHEKFGLNKYSKDSFYLGQKKNNIKEGFGFLKINEVLYIWEVFQQTEFMDMVYFFIRKIQFYK